jgi:hypothetical protein
MSKIHNKMRIDVVVHHGIKHSIEASRDRAERHAYAHTDIQLFTEEEFEHERAWIAEFAGEQNSHAVINAARAAYIDDVSAGKYVEVYIYFFGNPHGGGDVCEIVVYKDIA